MDEDVVVFDEISSKMRIKTSREQSTDEVMNKFKTSYKELSDSKSKKNQHAQRMRSVSLQHSNKNDAKLTRATKKKNPVEISDEESLSEIENKLKFYKDQVKIYQNKVKRKKKLKEEQEETEQVMNVRKPIDISRCPSDTVTNEYTDEQSWRNRRFDTNDRFQSIQDAKDLICNSSSEDEKSTKKSYQGSEKLSKFKDLMQTANTNLTRNPKSSRIIRTLHKNRKSQNSNNSGCIGEDNDDDPYDDNDDGRQNFLDKFTQEEEMNHSKWDIRQTKEKVLETVKQQKETNKYLVQRNRKSSEEYSDDYSEETDQEHLNVGRQKTQIRVRSRSINKDCHNRDYEEIDEENSHIRTQNVNSRRRSRQRGNYDDEDEEENVQENSDVPMTKKRKVLQPNTSKTNFIPDNSFIEHKKQKTEIRGKGINLVRDKYRKDNIQERPVYYAQMSDDSGSDNLDKSIEEDKEVEKGNLQKKNKLTITSHKGNGKKSSSLRIQDRNRGNNGFRRLAKESDSESDDYNEDNTDDNSLSEQDNIKFSRLGHNKKRHNTNEGEI